MTSTINLDEHEAREARRLLSLLGDVGMRSGDLNMQREARQMSRAIEEKLERAGISLNAPAPQHAPIVTPTSAPKEWPKTADGSTVFRVPAGIGDLAVMAMKLCGLAQRWGSPVKFIVAGDSPRRSEEFVRLLPGVEFAGYSDDLTPTILEQARALPLRKLEDYRGRIAAIEANGHLELGRRIEEWHSETPTTFNLKLNTTMEHQDRAGELIGECHGPLVGIYPASYSAARNWGFFLESAWIDVLKGVNSASGCTFVLIGASFDVDLVSGLSRQLEADGIPFVKCLGESFGVVVEVLKAIGLFLAFPSGLPIVSILIGTPTIWWLPQSNPDESSGGNVRNFKGFIPPSAIVDTRTFESPSKALEGILTGKPFDRLTAGS